ncbi:hypothetical protein [Pyruvatibacter mobilis]|uniref:hypothetical protein n=1 Tax=Pyruvatibacter mobilis TaxID=1712261 RepID=UPI003BAAD716
MFSVVAHDEMKTPLLGGAGPRETIIFFGPEGQRFYAFRGDPGVHGAGAACDNKGESYGFVVFPDALWATLVSTARNSLQRELYLTCEKEQVSRRDEDGELMSQEIDRFGLLIPNEQSASPDRPGRRNLK